MQLVRADALLARRNQKNRLQPQTKRNVTRFKDGADLDSEGLAAFVAFVDADASAGAAETARTVDHAAMRADNTIRPNARFDEIVGRLFVVKVGLREDGFRHDALRYERRIVVLIGYVKYKIAKR